MRRSTLAAKGRQKRRGRRRGRRLARRDPGLELDQAGGDGGLGAQRLGQPLVHLAPQPGARLTAAAGGDLAVKSDWLWLKR